MVREQARKVLEIDKAIRAKMSAPGTLNLPPLLEARRLQYGITDGAFRLFPLGERVVMWQMPIEEKTAGGLYKPDTVKDREHAQSPRGILVGAGLRALDILRSNGIELGHVIRTVAYLPLRLEADNIAGKSTYVLPMNAGDIVGSEDLAEMVREGHAMVATLDDGTSQLRGQGMPGRGRPLLPYVNPAEY